MMRSVNFSDLVSEWGNSSLYLIDENTFYSELMRCKRYLRPLRREKKGERCLSATNVRFEESVLTISYFYANPYDLGRLQPRCSRPTTPAVTITVELIA